MNLLFPAFLGAAAGIFLPVILHLLRLPPRRRLPLPSLRFLGPEARRDSRRHRLRGWWVLLLRCLLIALLVTAFARPFWRLPHTDHSRAVIVIADRSFSMQAAGRETMVSAWLAPILASLKAPDQLGVVFEGPEPEWAVRLSRDVPAGKAALRPWPRSYRATDYRAALDLAAAVLDHSQVDQKQIVVAGDGQSLGWQTVDFGRKLPSGIELLTPPPAPAVRRQAALTLLTAERIADTLRFDVSIRAFAPVLDQRTITFFANGKRLGERSAFIGAGRVTHVTADFAVDHPEQAQALKATADADDLPVDDVVYAVLPGASDRRVMLPPVANGQFDFLGQALGSATGRGVPSFQVDDWTPGRPWPLSDVAVWRGAAPFRAANPDALDAFLAAGGSAWLLCDGSAEQAAWLKRHGIVVKAEAVPADTDWQLRDLESNHPLFRAFAEGGVAPLLAVDFNRGWRVESEEAEVLARWPDQGAAIAEVAVGSGRLLITGFGADRRDSDFPIQAAFLPLVNQAVAWLADSTVATPNAARVGQPLTLPEGGTWESLDSPVAVASRAAAAIEIPAAPGLYRWQLGSSRRFYAVNLDPAESDLTPWPLPGDFVRLSGGPPPASPRVASHPGAGVKPGVVDERQAWWWLLALALPLLLLELACANRTAP